MRFVVVGAGAIGGAIGGLLHRAGHDVVLVARGEHGRTMAERGLLLKRPDEEFVIDVTVALDIAEVELTADDVLILATKSQHTAGLVEQIAPMPVTGAPDGTTAGDVLPIVCAQNGVANETVALRRFARVYGLLVQQPTTFLEPGIVAAHGLPQPGILPIGRVPPRRRRDRGAHRRRPAGRRVRLRFAGRRDGVEVHEAARQPAQRHARAAQAVRD